MTQTARFWDRVARRYANKPVPDEAVYRRKLEITRGYLRPGMDVLEIGCGTGSTAIAHAPFVRRIDALDISTKMLEIACDRAVAAHVDNVTFTPTTIADFDAPVASYDAVLGLSILHLLDDWQIVIERVFGWLRPGGVFVSGTACLGDSMRWFRYVGPVGKFLGLMPEVIVFTAAELRASLSTAGFRIEHDWQPGRNKAVFIVAQKPG